MDRVTERDLTASQDNSHDASLADEGAMLVSLQYCSHKPWLEVVQLGAGIAEASYFDDGSGAKVQARTGWKPKQINTASGDILAHLSGGYGKTDGMELVVELCVDQVDLAQVGLAGVARYP